MPGVTEYEIVIQCTDGSYKIPDDAVGITVDWHNDSVSYLIPVKEEDEQQQAQG